VNELLKSEKQDEVQSGLRGRTTSVLGRGTMVYNWQQKMQRRLNDVTLLTNGQGSKIRLHSKVYRKKKTNQDLVKGNVGNTL
jgi:hypothetical protein